MKKHTDTKKKNGYILSDVVIICVSIALAVVLVKSQIITLLLSGAVELKFMGSFLAGMFFTTIFTTAPAIATLAKISTIYNPFWVATFGALGAVCGDVIILKFFRDRFSKHIMELVGHQGVGRRLIVLFRSKSFRWFTFFLGGLIIASPLPDELGIGMIGFSKTKTSWFVPLSFVFNFIGILAIGFAARSFA